MFSIAAMIYVMVSRCKTAVCAMQTAGDLVEEHGFYGEGWTSGETLTLVDATGDAWIFHVSADPTHKSAYWAAQRVPDGHLAVVANSYILREIKPDHADFMHSKNLFASTQEHGLWDGVGVFDWCKVIGNFVDRPWYTSTRLYSVMNRVSPSSNIQPNENPLDYPMTVPVEKKMAPIDLMNLYRTFYEGTEFDMTKGVLAGVFGLPYRLEIMGEGGSSWPHTKGQFARGLSIPRNAYCIVAHPVPEEPIVFLNMDMPATGVFVPFLARTLTEASLEVKLEDTMNYYADSYSKGLRTKFSRDSAWWAFNFVANWMTINFKNMSAEYVYPAVEEWQPKALAAAEEATTKAAKNIQETLVEFWWTLADTLVIRYNDNYMNFPEHKPDEVFTIGYDEEWLKMVGYDDDFVRPQQVESQKECQHNRTTMQYATEPVMEMGGMQGMMPMCDFVLSLAKGLNVQPHHFLIGLAALGTSGVFLAGVLVGKFFAAPQEKRTSENVDLKYELLA